MILICLLPILLIILILLLLIIKCKYVKTAHAIFDGRNNIQGFVNFYQERDGVLIEADVHNLSDGKHGFHIHSKGDISDMDCKSACDHYNPRNVVHGGLNDGHVGDLGNIISKNKYSHTLLKTNKFKLNEIIGRTIIIHSDEDDLGLATDPSKIEESLKTGNAGSRIACAIIYSH